MKRDLLLYFQSMPTRGETVTKAIWAILFLSAFAADGFGQNAEGRTEVKADQGLNFGGSAFDLPSSVGPSSFDTRNDFKNADLILATVICPLCLGCCCLWELGSSRPFYISKIKFESTDFSQPLALKDPSRFELIDSIKDGTGAQLPHSKQVPTDGKYLVLSTSSGKYVLMTVSEITMFIPDYGNPTRQCANGAKTNWWIQNSGNPHFPLISSAIVAPRIPEIKHPVFDFQVNGRKIPDNLKKP